MQRTLSRKEVASAQLELRSIRSRERGMRHDRRGALSLRDEAKLQVRLDRLTRKLRLASR